MTQSQRETTRQGDVFAVCDRDCDAKLLPSHSSARHTCTTTGRNKKKRRLIRSFEIIMSIINNQYSFNNNNHVDNVPLHEPKSEVLI